MITTAIIAVIFDSRLEALEGLPPKELGARMPVVKMLVVAKRVLSA